MKDFLIILLPFAQFLRGFMVFALVATVAILYGSHCALRRKLADLQALYDEHMQLMNDRCTQQSLDHIAASKRNVEIMQQLRVENDALRRRLEDLTRPRDNAPEDECPAECSFCTGEACNKCGAGCWADGSAPHCEHDCSERHEQPDFRKPL